MPSRFVDEDAAVRAAARALRTATPNVDARGPALARFEAWMRRQPEQPRLVGAVAAAEVLGVKPPHLARLREQGRMPDPLTVEGSFSVYLLTDVEKLAAELAEERAEREQRRVERQRGGRA